MFLDEHRQIDGLERAILDESLGRAIEAAETVVRRGVGAAMNAFNA